MIGRPQKERVKDHRRRARRGGSYLERKAMGFLMSDDGDELPPSTMNHIRRISELPKVPLRTTSTNRNFLRASERWQVDQSINLMDASDITLGSRHDNTRSSDVFLPRFGELSTDDSRSRSTTTRGFWSMFRSMPLIPASPNNSFNASLGSLWGSTTPTGEVEADEEMGTNNKNARKKSRRNKKKRDKKKKKKRQQQKLLQKERTQMVPYPPDYDMALWEARALDVSRQELLLDPSENRRGSLVLSSSSNKTAAAMSREQQLQQKLTTKQQKANKQKRIRWDRVACLGFLLFVLLVILFMILILTGQVAWFKVKSLWGGDNSNSEGNSGGIGSNTTTSTSPDLPYLPPSVPTTPPNMEASATTTTTTTTTTVLDDLLAPRNHSIMDLSRLPTSTQLLLDDWTDDTPQNQALQWLIQDPHVTIYGDYTHESNSTEPLTPLEMLPAVQRFVLATLYYATNGKQWKDSQYWLSYDHNECEWFYQENLHVHNHNPYVICNRYHQIHQLKLRWQGLQGTLPLELSLLPRIQQLDVGHNNLTGIFPQTLLQTWKHLEILDLQHNQLTGPLPILSFDNDDTNTLQYLRTFIVNKNQFIGTIPTDIGRLVSNQKLRVLEMDRNSLSGKIPTEIGGLPGIESPHHVLESLSLSDNQFLGLIPSQIGRLTQLTSLKLQHNPYLVPQVMPLEICALQQYGVLQTIVVDCDIVDCPTNGCQCDCSETMVMDGATSKTTTTTQEEEEHGDSVEDDEEEANAGRRRQKEDVVEKEQHHSRFLLRGSQ